MAGKMSRLTAVGTFHLEVCLKILVSGLHETDVLLQVFTLRVHIVATVANVTVSDALEERGICIIHVTQRR